MTFDGSWSGTETADTCWHCGAGTERPVIPTTHWQLRGTEPVRAFLASLGTESQEWLIAMFVDDTLGLLAVDTLGQGGTGAVRLDLQHLVVRTAQLRATGLILAHNHPSGEARPSIEDINATRRISAALGVIDVTLLDHFIVAGQDQWSARAAGYL